MKKANKTTSGASIQKAGQQNSQFGTEFASETDVSQIHKQGKKAKKAKKQY